MEAMLEYQKLADKEIREDERLKSASMQQALQERAAKLKVDNKSIDEAMDEAREKASNLMDAANAALVIGIVSGALTIGAGALSSRDGGVMASDVGTKPLGPLSPFQAAAALDVVLSDALPASVRARLRERKGEVLALVTSSSKPRPELGTSLRALFAKDPMLASADWKKLFPLAIVDASMEAMEQLRTAQARSSGNADLEQAEQRAVAILHVLYAMVHQLG
jgi:hypothetical protein